MTQALEYHSTMHPEILNPIPAFVGYDSEVASSSEETDPEIVVAVSRTLAGLRRMLLSAGFAGASIYASSYVNL